MDNNIEFSHITEKDIPEIHKLAYAGGGNRNLTLKNFTHWYLNNPTGAYSVRKVLQNGAIEGYAMSSCFDYNINNKDYFVAMPQNALASDKIRGRGIYGKLYYKTEDENLNQNKVDFFWASGGKMSTPIFLNRLGYVRGVCPDLIVKLPTSASFFSSKKYKLIENVEKIQFDSVFNLENSRKKNLEYYKWRYSVCDSKILKILEVSDNNKILGYAFLIVKKKWGIKTLMLADILCSDENSIEKIIDACQVFTSKKLFFCLFMIKLYINNKKSFQLALKNKFVFMFKGKSEKETQWLSELHFNYFFGDLDYFW